MTFYKNKMAINWTEVYHTNTSNNDQVKTQSHTITQPTVQWGRANGHKQSKDIRKTIKVK